MEKPRFKHDCTECEFLGRYETHAYAHFIDDDRTDPLVLYDLYVHWDSDGTINTVIARHSDEGSEYTCGLYGLSHLALQEALRRAIKLMRRVT